MLQDNSCDVPKERELTNYQNVCRTCLYSGAQLRNAFDVTFADDVLVNILKRHLFIEIKQDDQLPKLLCKNCIREIDRIHTFIKKSKSSESKLLACANYEFVEVKTEPNDNSGNKLVSLYDVKEEVPVGDTHSENELHSIIDIKPEDDDANESDENSEIGSSKNIEPVLVPERGPPYICACNNTFKSQSDIIRHRTETNHLEIKEYICEFCNNGKHYSFSRCLRHINLHKQVQLTSATDNVRGCDRGFKTVQRHSRGYKRKKLLSDATKCDDKDLQRLTEELPCCQFCYQRFTSNEYLTIHKRWHCYLQPTL